MERYPWWAEDHKKLAQEVEVFAEEVMPRDEETRWRRDFPSDIFDKVAERGYTGACIVEEELNRMPGGRVFVGNMLGG